MTVIIQNHHPLPPLTKGGRRGVRARLTTYHIFLVILSIWCFLTDSPCLAEETIITSDSLEYSKKTSKYVATGNVNIQREETTIEADEVIYIEKTGDVTATGSVKYTDPTVSIQASRAELNINSKTGKLYDAEILFTEDNYRVAGREIEKRGDTYYVSPEARFTTCDGPVPAWCFKGKDINLNVGKEIKARDVSFHINKVPVLYIPYMKASLLSERQTGFLIPSLEYSKTRGASLRAPFFWAISDDRDATFILDYYSKRGIGEGIEYRYIKPEDITGTVWLYHIRDTSLKKDFFEMKVSHEQRSASGPGGYLNINYVNEKAFFREFELELETRSNRFLESTGEISLPLWNSRLYLLGQYWVDLKEGSAQPPQKLPEAGLVIHPTSLGDFWVSATAVFSNFWRDEGVFGQRFDIYPKIRYMFGRDVIVKQNLGVRGSAYYLHGGEDDFIHRENLEYGIVASTRLFKKYASFTHILEPSVSYQLITDSDEAPLLDSTELFTKTSEIELSLLNRFIDEEGDFMVMRISQAYDIHLDDRPFLPLKLEVGIKRPLSLRFDARYDVHEGELESVNSDLFVRVYQATLSMGQRYNRRDDISTYVGGIEINPFRAVRLGGRIWYDADEREVREFAVNMRYDRKCWGAYLEFYKRPGDFTAVVMFDLKGISGPF